MPTKVFVNVSTSKLVEEAPDLYAQAALYSTLSNEPITDHIIGANLKSLDLLTKRYFRYGRDTYANGLPTVDYRYSYPTEADIKTILDTKHSPDTVTVDKVYVSNLNSDYYVFQYLQENYNWNSINNLLEDGGNTYEYHSHEFRTVVSNQGDTFDYYIDIFRGPTKTLLESISEPAYSVGVHANYHIDIATTAYSTTAPALVSPSSNALLNDNPQTITFAENGTTVDEWQIWIGDSVGSNNLYDSGVLTGVNSVDAVGLPSEIVPRHLTLRYKDLTVSPNWVDTYYTFNIPLPTGKYFVTDNNGDEFPSLGKSTTNYPGDQYLPIANVRTDGVSITEDTDSIEYKQNKKMLDMINLDVDELLTGIEENPDIDVIDDAFVLYGVDIYSEDSADAQYLYKFFDQWENRSIGTKAAFDAARIDPNTTVPRQTANFIEQQYNTELSYNYITKEVFTGSIGPINTYTKNLVFKDPIYDTVIVDDERDGGTKTIYIPIRDDQVVLNYQVNATQFIQIRVHGLKHESAIKGRGIQYIEKTLTTDSEDLENLGFIIPIEYNILYGLDTRKDRNTVLYNSLNIVIYTVEVVKLKWYQTGIFKTIITFIAIVLAVYTGGKSLYLAYSTGGIVAVTIAALKLVIVSLIVDYAIEWIVANVKGFLGKLIAVIALIYLGKLSGNSLGSLSLADKAMKIVDIFVKVQGISNKLELENINAELKDLQDELEVRDEEMKAIQELLDGTNPLENPLYMLNGLEYNLRSDEAVSDFIDRTIHNQNPGVQILDIPRHYVESALYLPNEGDIPDLIMEDK